MVRFLFTRHTWIYPPNRIPIKFRKILSRSRRKKSERIFHSPNMACPESLLSSETSVLIVRDRRVLSFRINCINLFDDTSQGRKFSITQNSWIRLSPTSITILSPSGCILYRCRGASNV